MATKEKILEILAGESGPMSRVGMSRKLGEPLSNFQNQLDRLERQGLVGKNEQKEYTLTDAGREYALDEAGITEGGEKPTTEESLETTEYQQFVKYGKETGIVPAALITMTASHIWRGGDFRDLTWVWKGLTEMGVRADLAQRWFHAWGSYLHQPVPPALAFVTTAQTPEGIPPGKEAEGKGKRDHILDGNGLPLYVGEGVGDLDHDEAVKLSALRQAALARGGAQAAQAGQPATLGGMADELTKVYQAIQTFQGPQSKGKSYLVKPGEEGYAVEEIEEGKPTLVPTPQSNANPSQSFLIDNDGNVQEMPAGRPVVIKQPAPAPNPPAPGKTFIVRQTPEGIVAEEHDISRPIIINNPAPGSNIPPIYPFPVLDGEGKPVLGQDGQPVYANLEPMLKYMGFQGEQRRADERHSALMGLVQTVKENVPDGIQAIREAAAEARGSAGGKTPQQPHYECNECHSKFTLTREPGEGENVKCPTCGHEWSREEVIAT